jgi:CheY-like chemotaxis protein
MFDIPMIFLTAYADDQRIVRAQDVSPYGYLIRPFRDDRLLDTIQSALIRETLEAGAR